MTSRVIARATYEDLLQVPENLVAELIDGEVYASPRPGGPHNNAASVLGMIVGSAYHIGNGGPGGWWIHYEPELHLSGGDVLVPDLAGWRRERMPEIPKNHIYSIPPDWVCEALSESTERVDRAKKLPIYARNGVSYAWIVDAIAQYVEVKRLVNGVWTDIAAFAGEDTMCAEPFEKVEITLSLLWGAPPS
jgi:Uma2 family endonuclease